MQDSDIADAPLRGIQLLKQMLHRLDCVACTEVELIRLVSSNGADPAENVEVVFEAFRWRHHKENSIDGAPVDRVEIGTVSFNPNGTNKPLG